MTISADVDTGYLVDERVKFIQNSIAQDWDKGVKIDFKGDKKINKNQEHFVKGFYISDYTNDIGISDTV